MNTPFENDQELFKQLDSIPRSEQQKQRSFLIIQDRLQMKKKSKKSVFLSIATIVTCLCFMIGSVWIINQHSIVSPNTSNSPFHHLVTENKIQRTLVAKSQSEKFFNIDTLPGLKMGTIAIDQDLEWNKNMKEILNQLKETKKGPTVEPKYDMAIVWENSTNLKFKLYIEEGYIIFKDMSKNKFYRLDGKYAISLESLFKSISVLN